MFTDSLTPHLKPIAQAGLVAKGIVYSLFGILTFMAAFHMNGKSVRHTDKDDVFSFVYEQTGGQIMLGIIALGLLCYCMWRMIQALSDTEDKGSHLKGILNRLRYVLSGLVYGSLALHVIKLLFLYTRDSGDGKQTMARTLMNQPFGQWLVGMAALILLGIGVYQIYYGLSNHYKKHVEKIGRSSNPMVLLAAGKIGFIARGIVWVLIAWLFFKAAWHANSSEAGDSSKAFSYLQSIAFGSYLLAIMGIGLLCYGIFNFIRMRYENL